MNPLSVENFREEYETRGFKTPIRVLSDNEANESRGRFLDFYAGNQARVQALPPRDQYVVFSETHTSLDWVYRIGSHPRILDAVETILGPNLLIWGSRWFVKMPGDKTYISWHQDATYWGMHPPHVTTAWIALSESNPSNGCMRVIPGTHRGDLLPQRETYSDNNALSRGQEIAVEVDENQAVDLVLQPGEMSLHDIGLVHGSNVNSSSNPRIGIAFRYLTPEVAQDGNQRSFAMLVRGRDSHGHFDLLPAPDKSELTAGDAQSQAIQRMMKSVMRGQRS
jgi:non-heme Fe2+,alpha-ketoglutarate-dependent halogenase